MSVWQRPAARTRTKACPGLIFGRSMSAMPATPAAVNRMAFILFSLVPDDAARSASAHPVATVDIVGLRQDIVAVGRGQKHGEPRNIFGLRKTADRNGPGYGRLLLTRLQAFPAGEVRIDNLPMLAIDDARRYRVDVDTVFDQRQGGGLCRRNDRCLGGAVECHQRLAAAA